MVSVEDDDDQVERCAVRLPNSKRAHEVVSLVIFELVWAAIHNERRTINPCWLRMRSWLLECSSTPPSGIAAVYALDHRETISARLIVSRRAQATSLDHYIHTISMFSARRCISFLKLGHRIHICQYERTAKSRGEWKWTDLV